MNGSLQGTGNLNRQLAGLAALAALLAMANPAFGANRIWNGNTSADWATAANWDAAFVSGDKPIFGTAGSSGTTLNNNLTAGINVAGMTFNAGGAAFTINGNAITLTGDSTISATVAQIINLDMALSGTPRKFTLSGAGGNLTLGGVLSGAGAFQKAGTAAATLFLNGLNSFGGEFGAVGVTSINTLTNAGLNCSIGTAATFQLGVSGSGQITYTGPATSTDRQAKIGQATDGTGTGTLLNNSTANGAMTFTATTFNIAPGAGIATARTLALGGSSTAINEIQGVIQDNNTGGGGLISVSLGASSYAGGTWKLSGANTYSGVTTISYGGVLEANTLANGGANSSIGKAGNVAANLVFGNSGGTLRYTGSANASTDRAFTLSASSTFGAIESSGAGTLSFTDSSVPLAYGTVDQGRTLILGGSNTGTNTFGKTIANNGTAAVVVNKNGAGRWILSVANAYTGNTAVNDGALEAADGTGLPTTSILQLRGGVFQSSGTFSRAVTTAAGGVNWATSSGGFAARGAPLILNLNGGTASLTWNGSSFVPTGQTLIFGSATATALVDFQNGIKLAASGNNNLDRTIVVNDNPLSTQDVARISGTITTDSSNNGIVKQGAGVLQLTRANTYNGTTTVSNGTLLVDNTTGSGTGTGTVTVNAGGYVGGDGSIGGNLVMAGGGFAAQVGKVLDVGGNLDLSAANDSLIVLGAMPTSKTLVLKYSGSLTGTFNNTPTGYTVTYDTTNKEISIGPAAPSGTVVVLR